MNASSRKRVREEELRQLLDSIDKLLASVEERGEPAWKTIRESREDR